MDRLQLLKEEYLTLRKEIENAKAEIASLEQYSVIAIAASQRYAFAGTVHSNTVIADR